MNSQSAFRDGLSRYLCRSQSVKLGSIRAGREAHEKADKAIHGRFAAPGVVARGNHLLKQLEIIDREPSDKETIRQRLVSLLQYTLKAEPDDRPIIACNLRDLQGDIEKLKTGVTAKLYGLYRAACAHDLSVRANWLTLRKLTEPIGTVGEVTL